MDVVQAPLTVALILFTLAQMAVLAVSVFSARSETKALRAELATVRADVARTRADDKELVQVKLDAITESVRRIEKQISDIARLVGGGKRAEDHSSLTE